MEEKPWNLHMIGDVYLFHPSFTIEWVDIISPQPSQNQSTNFCHVDVGGAHDSFPPNDRLPFSEASV